QCQGFPPRGRELDRRMAPRAHHERVPIVHEAALRLGSLRARGDLRRAQRAGAAHHRIRYAAPHLARGILPAREPAAVQARPGLSRAPVMISVVVPVYNNGATVGELARRVGAALRPSAYEIIFVDDGSSDDSLARLKSIAASSPEVKLISLARNF